MKIAATTASPRTNIEFWQEKISRNIERDLRTEAELTTLGWSVIRVWECEIKTIAQREATLDRLYRRIVGDKPVHTYIPENVGTPMAAEPSASYGKSGL